MCLQYTQMRHKMISSKMRRFFQLLLHKLIADFEQKQLSHSKDTCEKRDLALYCPARYIENIAFGTSYRN